MPRRRPRANRNRQRTSRRDGRHRPTASLTASFSGRKHSLLFPPRWCSHEGSYPWNVGHSSAAVWSSSPVGDWWPASTNIAKSPLNVVAGGGRRPMRRPTAIGTIIAVASIWFSTAASGSTWWPTRAAPITSMAGFTGFAAAGGSQAGRTTGRGDRTTAGACRGLCAGTRAGGEIGTTIGGGTAACRPGPRPMAIGTAIAAPIWCSTADWGSIW